MRIVAGQFKGRAIAAPKTNNTRPTSDRARESLFNILAHASWSPPVAGARVLDMFAGSGALGLEAMSRGAEFCLFVEQARPAQSAILKNIADLDLSKATKLLRKSAIQPGLRPDGPWFDLVFMDPPYHKDLIAPCLAALVKGDWLSRDALIVAETAANEVLALEGWDVLNERKSGAAKFWFLAQA